ncbi:hypothetical protein [Fimbriiglobus ruber]|uniref:Sel1 repeat family protein n=1 Tax=Fimbriiglobus ruber TaxID=1908690 RepID=A0A225DTQ0_9BACT|nr:hypothetical protein [Fimbriiglobus ruber]OWK42984.1 hypothetical protein FRUB_02583 [Fimbriiglobus ruber]
MGSCYENGLGVETSLTEAAAWYQTAVTAGYGPATQALQRVQGKQKPAAKPATYDTTGTTGAFNQTANKPHWLYGDK